MEQKYSKSYENLMVLTLFLLFGFVMFDRFALSNLATYVMADLSMDAAQLGVITSVFAYSWAICGYIASAIADMARSRKIVLGVCVIAFSILSLLTGVAGGFVSMCAIRFILGIFEGPILPISQSINVTQSSENRRGLNGGLIQVVAPGLISTMLGPIICVWLCENFGWRVTFYLTIIPGLIIAFMIFKILKEPVIESAEKPRFGESLKVCFTNRNVIVSILAGIFILYWYICTLAFAQPAIVGKGIPTTDAAVIMSALGVGAIIWGILVPIIGDKIGRKPTIIIFMLIASIAPFSVAFSSSYAVMMVCFCIGWCGAGVFALFESVIPVESIDPRYAASAISIVQLFGELIGAGFGATLCGTICATKGFESGMITVGIAAIIAAIIAFGYFETCPAVLAKNEAKRATFEKLTGKKFAA